MVNGYHLHKATDRKRFLDGNNRLVLKKSFELARVQHDGRLQYANLLRETIEEYGCPAIFNTDQGSQFTSDVFIKVLVDYYIQISMDGKDRTLDNIRIERLWRSLKYKDIYLKRYETMKDLKTGIDAYFNFYNTARFHQSLDYSGQTHYKKYFHKSWREGVRYRAKRLFLGLPRERNYNSFYTPKNV